MPEHEEIEEHIHHAHEPFDKLVAGSMAIIAAFLAVVSVLGQHFNTETLLTQQESSDQWAFYQAKNIRRYSAQVGQDILTQLKAPPESIAKYAEDGAKEKADMKEIQQQAIEFKNESVAADAKSTRFHGGEVFLEVGIVLSSLAILTKRKPYYFGGALFAAGGIIYAATAFVK
jgi:hypothetical protein